MAGWIEHIQAAEEAVSPEKLYSPNDIQLAQAHALIGIAKILDYHYLS